MANDLEIWTPPSYRRPAEIVPSSNDYDGRIPQGDPLLKALQQTGVFPKHTPYRYSSAIHGLGGYQGIVDPEGVTTRTNQVMRNTAKKVPVLGLIIGKRVSQISRYLKFYPTGTRGIQGATVRMRHRKKSPTPAAIRRMEEIQQILENGGYPRQRPGPGRNQPVASWSADGQEKAMGFGDSVSALVRDSLILDAAAFRIEPGENDQKYPVAFWTPVDAALVRKTNPRMPKSDATGGYTPTSYRPDIRQDQEQIDYVLMDLYSNTPLREFAWNELEYMVRNVRTDLAVKGYGLSEIEMAIDLLLGLTYSMKYNTEFFDSSHMPPGILELFGKFGDDALKEFRRQLKSMVGGQGHFWDMPILATENGTKAANYVPIRQENPDMMFQQFFMACATVLFGLYNMDPSECGFVPFGQSSNALANSSPTAKLEYAQETGESPLLNKLAIMFNGGIVSKIDSDFEFGWLGLPGEDEEMETEETEFRLTMGLSTPNAERARYDEPPIRDPLDPDLFEACMDKVKKAERDDESTDTLLQLAQDMYKLQGGKFARWPDAPVGCAAALDLWKAEHGIGQQQDPSMPPGGAPIDPSQQPDQGAIKPNAQGQQQNAQQPQAGGVAGGTGKPKPGLKPPVKPVGGPAQAPKPDAQPKSKGFDVSGFFKKKRGTK